MMPGINMFRDYASNIWRDRYILWALTQSALELKYKRSALGVVWSVLVPLGLAFVIGGVYGILFNVTPRDFLPVLFSGLNVWMFISGCADGGTQAFLAAEGYLKQTPVNMEIFPLRIVLTNFINLLYALGAYFLVYLFLGLEYFSLNMLLLIPGLALTFLFCLALSNITAVLNLWARDYQPLQSILLQGFFYATPIIYLPEMLKDKGYGFVYEWNPMYYFVSIVRTPLLGKEIAPLSEYIIASAIVASLFVFSVWLIMGERKRGVVFKL